MTQDVVTLPAPAKVNLALVVGPRRPGGKHEVMTVLQALELADQVSVQRAEAVAVEGFADDTLVRAALEAICARTGAAFAATIEKQVPVAAGLGGGSADAAAALRGADALLDEPLAPDELHGIAARLGADVPFFLAGGTQLGTGDGTCLTSLALPTGYAVLLALPEGVRKASTGGVYAAFDARQGERGFEERVGRLREALGDVRDPRDLARLPGNDLSSSPLADELRSLGAWRADVSGAGPAVYGLFPDAGTATAAAQRLAGSAQIWVTRPVGAHG